MEKTVEQILKIQDAEELQDAIVGFGILNIILGTAPEPFKTKALEALDSAKTYTVFNPGKAFNVGYQKKKVKVANGVNVYPKDVALFLLTKFGKGTDATYGKTDNSVLLDTDPKAKDVEKLSDQFTVPEFTENIKSLSVDEALALVSPDEKRSGVLKAVEEKESGTKVGE